MAASQIDPFGDEPPKPKPRRTRSKPAAVASVGDNSALATKLAQLNIIADGLRDERDALRAELEAVKIENERLLQLVPADPNAETGPFDPKRPHRIVEPFRGIIGAYIMEYRGDHSEIVRDPQLLQQLHDAGARMVQL